jgi:hypothetical protein
MNEDTRAFLEKELRAGRENTPEAVTDTGKNGLAIELDKPNLSPPVKVPEQKEEETQPRTRHSLKTCACEKCQEKRLALARTWGITPSESISQEDFTWLDEEVCGELLTAFDNHKHEMWIIKEQPQLAKLWEVQEKRKENLGKAGHIVLNKYVGDLHFKHKELTLLLAWVGFGTVIRLNSERQMKVILGLTKPKQPKEQPKL